jgi:hypothetical protein
MDKARPSKNSEAQEKNNTANEDAEDMDELIQGLICKT